ncbi:predicted protein [Histoplasma mississippiense (nom. inval.)]|uniref:predicted protein n=1 Tax=Ajellomyces capsulatus (strain NAm1 / WU24) TaxID=2059318 RepID=UPI000157C885|nr:predicted protein [Histoplasma mississippiense (nom. inval.)]EDN09408.1 predicted protein [Histoplasma mississippiense (nom. inval.)]
MQQVAVGHRATRAKELDHTSAVVIEEKRSIRIQSEIALLARGLEAQAQAQSREGMMCAEQVHERLLSGASIE